MFNFPKIPKEFPHSIILPEMFKLKFSVLSVEMSEKYAGSSRENLDICTTGILLKFG